MPIPGGSIAVLVSTALHRGFPTYLGPDNIGHIAVLVSSALHQGGQMVPGDDSSRLIAVLIGTALHQGVNNAAIRDSRPGSRYSWALPLIKATSRPGPAPTSACRGVHQYRLHRGVNCSSGQSTLM